MNSAAGTAIMMNNYFHDVATAMLAASGIALWIVVKKYAGSVTTDMAAREYFLKVHKSLTRVARFSLYFVLVAGIPRTLTFRSFEWSNAVEHGQIPALIVKHILTFSVVSLGVFLWLRLGKRITVLKGEMGA